MTADRPDDLESRLLPNQLLQQAAQAAKDGDLVRAREYCAQVLSQDPNHKDALLWQSVVTEDLAEKMRSLQKILEAEPQDGRARILLNWAQSRQARGESGSLALELECLTSCPCLGTVDDRQARFTYPCAGNVCHAEATKRRLPREIAEDTQEEVCLTVAHLTCPTYCRVQAIAEKQQGNLPALRDYFDFFGFDEEPFSIVPIPRFFYPARQHEEALKVCRQVIQHRQGLTVLLGSVGLGKTLILRTLYQELFEDPHYAVAFIPHPKFRTEYALMRGILSALRAAPLIKRSLRDLDKAFEHYVTRQATQAQKTVVLLFDEAQQMHYRVLRQIRRLLDLHVEDQQMVQIVLAGQMSLAQKLAHLPALYDRVVARYTLSSLSPSDVKGLITARLHEAGIENGLFTPSAVRTISDITHGHPRQVNILCMRCLWEAFEQRRHVIDYELVMQVLNDKTAGQPLELKTDKEPSRSTQGVLSRLRLLWSREGSG